MLERLVEIGVYRVWLGEMVIHQTHVYRVTRKSGKVGVRVRGFDGSDVRLLGREILQSNKLRRNPSLCSKSFQSAQCVPQPAKLTGGAE